MSPVARVLAEDCRSSLQVINLIGEKVYELLNATNDRSSRTTYGGYRHQLSNFGRSLRQPLTLTSKPSPANRDTADGNEIKNSVKSKWGWTSRKRASPAPTCFRQLSVCGSPQMEDHWALVLSRAQQLRYSDVLG